VQDLKEAIDKKEPLLIDSQTVITPSVVEGVKGMRA
jgi:hypothetical protein